MQNTGLPTVTYVRILGAKLAPPTDDAARTMVSCWVSLAACGLHPALTVTGHPMPGQRTTTTGQAAWATRCWLTEPSSMPANPPWPRDPTTSRSALPDNSISTLAGFP